MSPAEPRLPWGDRSIGVAAGWCPGSQFLLLSLAIVQNFEPFTLMGLFFPWGDSPIFGLQRMNFLDL